MTLSSVEEFKKYFIDVPFQSLWCFYQVVKIDQFIHRILGLCKYTICHSLGTFSIHLQF
jgi:hypothetical protein